MDRLYEKAPDQVRYVYNFENRTMLRGQGGRENKGRKGHAFDYLPAGAAVDLLDAAGPGLIDHMWLTFRTSRAVMDPELMRRIKIEMFWDHAASPAVSAPLGDFFLMGFGRSVDFECELFSAPGGKCFNCYLPMPFHKHARIVLTNESEVDVINLFYSIEYRRMTLDADKTLYLHAHWRRERPGLDKDFTILPTVKGCGRFLGSLIQVRADQRYGKLWWGEGEVKMFIDGDGEFPSYIGTGAEDYPGTAWGLRPFHHRYQGCLLADAQAGLWSLYRFHIPDPIHFTQDIRVTVQQLGGGPKRELLALRHAGDDIRIVSVDTSGSFVPAYERTPPLDLEDESIALEHWCNFMRSDDWTAMAYFYLDRPENGLPALASSSARVADLNLSGGIERDDG